MSTYVPKAEEIEALRLTDVELDYIRRNLDRSSVRGLLRRLEIRALRTEGGRKELQQILVVIRHEMRNETTRNRGSS